MIRGTDIRAVLLDADGVIQLPDASWLEDIQAWCGDRGHVDFFLQDLFEAERPALTGQGDFRVSLLEVLRRWKVSVSEDDAVRVWHKIQPNAVVLNLIAELRSNRRTVALASNQQWHRATYMKDELGYAAVFDRLLFSCELGFAKPDLGYFEAALGRLGVRADEVLFVDDHPANVEAARRLGIHAEIFHLREGVNRLRSIFDTWGLLPAGSASGRVT